MIVSLIVAMDERGGIGLGGRVPWHLPADLKHFRRLTMGHHLILGRVTYESIGRPLPGRHMLVISRQADYRAEGCRVVASLDEAQASARESGEDEVFVAGGAQIFALALPLADRLHLTRVHAQVEADAFFPPFDLAEWVEVETRFHAADDRNPYPFTYSLLRRK